MAWELKLAAHVGMALEARSLGGPRWIHGKPGTEAGGWRTPRGEAEGRLGFTAGFGVQAARAVTGFATGVERILPRSDQPRMVRSGKIAVDLIVTLLAFFGANVLRAGNLRQI